MHKKYLILTASAMSDYILRDLENCSNVQIVNRCHAFSNPLANRLFRLHTALQLNKKIRMPFKKIWYRALLKPYFTAEKPDFVIMAYPWYDRGLLSYIRKQAPKAKILLQCTDKVDVEIKIGVGLSLEAIRKNLDGVTVYNPLDAQKYGFPFHSVGYSKVDPQELPQYTPCDVVFIGAAKNRLEDIRAAYEKFRNAGLSCYFYVTGVPKKQRREDGILYADKAMPFREYLAREISAKCLFELLQEGSTGRTYRLMEAIVYNKMLITNCPEILQMSYFDPAYVQYFQDVREINPEMVKQDIVVDYNYQGEFSAVHYLEFIDKTFGI